MKKRSVVSSGVTSLQYVSEEKKRAARLLRRNATPAEKLLWEALRNRKAGGLKFRRQQIIEGFIVDFFCHQAKLVVEVDGGIHDEEEQKNSDKHRRNVFAARGLKEIRFRNEEVINDIERVVLKIRKVVEERLE